jgi:MFS family permease
MSFQAPPRSWPDVTASLSSRWNQVREGLPPSFMAMLLGTFINRLGSFIVPLLFVYLTQRRGLGLVIAGQVAALFGLGSFIGTMGGGVLADRIGRRATMLWSLILGAGCMLMLGAAEQVHELAIATFLLGLTGDAFRPASQALVADVVPAEHRLKAFTIQYWAINLGFTFAAIIGGYMATRSFTALFVGDAATTLVLAAIVARLVPESRPAPKTDAPVKGSVLTPFADPRYAPFLLLNFAMAMVFFQHLTGLPEDMRQKGLSTEAFGWAISFNGVLIVLLQPSASAWGKRLGRSKVLGLAAALTGVGFGLTAFAGSLPTYVATVGVWTLGEILFAPVNASIVADLSPTEMRGRYQGAFTLTWSLAGFLSPGTLPWVMERVGMPVFWGLCAAVGLMIALAHLTVGRRLLGD